MKAIKTLTLINTVSILTLSLFLVYKNTTLDKQVVYINDNKLFNEFDMTKEIQVEGENTTRIASQELDSLIAKYQIIDDKSSEAAKLIQNQIMIRNRDLQKLQENYFKSSNSKITQRLNTYLKNYAEEHDYQLILGSNVLYSNKLIDKTQEAIIFINQKYDGL